MYCIYCVSLGTSASCRSMDMKVSVAAAEIQGSYACRKQPVLRTRLLLGSAAAVLVGAHHSGMTVGINSK